jgi:hypothetical protein
LLYFIARFWSIRPLCIFRAFDNFPVFSTLAVLTIFTSIYQKTAKATWKTKNAGSYIGLSPTKIRTLKILMFICVVQTTQILCDANFAQISTFFTQNLCGFHQIAQISIKIKQIYTTYLCTDLSHKIFVTSLADIQIFVRKTRFDFTNGVLTLFCTLVSLKNRTFYFVQESVWLVTNFYFNIFFQVSNHIYWIGSFMNWFMVFDRTCCSW